MKNHKKKVQESVGNTWTAGRRNDEEIVLRGHIDEGDAVHGTISRRNPASDPEIEGKRRVSRVLRRKSRWRSWIEIINIEIIRCENETEKEIKKTRKWEVVEKREVLEFGSGFEITGKGTGPFSTYSPLTLKMLVCFQPIYSLISYLHEFPIFIISIIVWLKLYIYIYI